METATTETLEVRSLEVQDIEFRAGQGEQPHRLVGYAATYNSLSADLGGFKERILPGAFKRSLTSGQDVRALVDHDPSKLLARTSSKTLRIAEDDKGLRYEIDLPDTSYAHDVRALVARGDVKGMSFGFKVPEGGQRFTKEGGQTIRELNNIDLREITVTSIPAYGSTSLSLRVDPSVIQHVKASDEKNRPLYAKSMAKFRSIYVKGLID